MTENKTPIPPIKPMFLPLVFWLDIIALLDKRIEMISNGSGYGIVAMDVKLQNGKIYEVGFEEKTRVRGIIEKAGNLGINNKVEPTSFAK